LFRIPPAAVDPNRSGAARGGREWQVFASAGRPKVPYPAAMTIELGQVEAIFRYPVKSMRGERVDAAALGLHGLEGDRRFALQRLEDRGGFPFLTASKLPELLRFAPVRPAGESLPTHVRTPEGRELEILGDELAAEVTRRHGAPVRMLRLDHGIFDDAAVSVIATGTVDEIARLAGREADVRRFRPNVQVRLRVPGAFRENAWVGGVLTFGEGEDAAAVAVTARDVRCAMVNLDPDSAVSAPEILRAVVAANGNDAGVYGTVTRVGRLEVGQVVRLRTDGA
jgi:uncharacterized protein YcbX